MVMVFLERFLGVSTYIAPTLLDSQLYTGRAEVLSMYNFGDRKLCNLIMLSVVQS